MSLFLVSSTHAHPHAHTHTMQLILQPENLFKYFPERLEVETEDEELKAESKWVTATRYSGRVKSWAVKPAHAFELMASPGRLLFLCSTLSFSWWLQYRCSQQEVTPRNTQCLMWPAGNTGRRRVWLLEKVLQITTGSGHENKVSGTTLWR